MLEATENISDNPLVSIIVRTKDRPALLKAALNSIINQTYDNIEVVIVNDGGCSIDDTIYTLSKQLKIIYVDHQVNKGRSLAANTGLSNSNGKMISFLDDDDLFLPDHIATLVNALKSDNSIGLVYSDCRKEDYNQKQIEIPFITIRRDNIFHGKNYDRLLLYRENYIPLITALFRKEILHKSGPFDEEMNVYEDWDLWIRMSMHTEFKRIEKITCKYRIFGKRDYNYLEGQMKIYKKYHYIYTPQQMRYWLHDIQSENHQLRSELADFIGVKKSKIKRLIKKILTPLNPD